MLMFLGQLIVTSNLAPVRLSAYSSIIEIVELSVTEALNGAGFRFFLRTSTTANPK
jgi:hypothetical protein